MLSAHFSKMNNGLQTSKYFNNLRIQIPWSSVVMFLNVLLHQSLTTTSSNKKAMTGSLDTALSSIQTSVTSVDSLLKKRELWIKENFQQKSSIITNSAHAYSVLIRIFGYLVQVICLILFYFLFIQNSPNKRSYYILGNFPASNVQSRDTFW
jgi:hypothetical protein